MRNNKTWISVTTRLPEKDGTYLTWHDGYYSVLDFNTKWGLWNASVTKETAIYTVTHWRELPVPPTRKG